MQTGAKPISHNVTMENRQSVRVTGVEDVDCFNEQVVVLLTSAGTLTISGEGLQVSQLSLEQGKLDITGDILAMEYAERSHGRKGGLLGRLFK